MALNASDSLRLFIDSASTEVWKKFLPTGVFQGVTTNPLLLRESNVACQIKSLSVLSKQAAGFGAKEVHLQAWGKTVDDLVRTGSQLASIDKSVVVQIPATYTGLKSARQLKDMGARIGLIIYSMHQALLALGIGAEYMALNVGKAPSPTTSCEEEEESKQNLSRLQSMVRGAGKTTKLLLANLSSVEEVTGLVASSSSTSGGQFNTCYALRPSIIEALFTDKVTGEMVNSFQAAVTSNNFSLFL